MCEENSRNKQEPSKTPIDIVNSQIKLTIKFSIHLKSHHPETENMMSQHFPNKIINSTKPGRKTRKIIESKKGNPIIRPKYFPFEKFRKLAKLDLIMFQF
jgi:hypothetical protein